MPTGKFHVVFDPRAVPDYKKLCAANPPLAGRISRLVDSLLLNPRKGKPLTGINKGSFSVRLGTYRVIYDLYVRERAIHIIRIGHRRDVYR